MSRIIAQCVDVDTYQIIVVRTRKREQSSDVLCKGEQRRQDEVWRECISRESKNYDYGT